MTEIPQEGHGMVSNVFPGAWVEGVSAAGNGTYGYPFASNPSYRVILARETRLTGKRVLVHVSHNSSQAASHSHLFLSHLFLSLISHPNP